MKRGVACVLECGDNLLGFFALLVFFVVVVISVTAEDFCVWKRKQEDVVVVGYLSGLCVFSLGKCHTNFYLSKRRSPTNSETKAPSAS